VTTNEQTTAYLNQARSLHQQSLLLVIAGGFLLRKWSVIWILAFAVLGQLNFGLCFDSDKVALIIGGYDNLSGQEVLPMQLFGCPDYEDSTISVDNEPPVKGNVTVAYWPEISQANMPLLTPKIDSIWSQFLPVQMSTVNTLVFLGIQRRDGGKNRGQTLQKG